MFNHAMAQTSNIYIAMAGQSFVDPPLALPVHSILVIFDVVLFTQYASHFIGLWSAALAGERHKCRTLER